MTEKEILKKAEVMFFPNGNTAVFINERQSAKHQKSWFLMFVKFLEKNGIDVLNSIYRLPSGDATLIKTENGYNWQFLEKKGKG